jgi:hypothetical protein
MLIRMAAIYKRKEMTPPGATKVLKKEQNIAQIHWLANARRFDFHRQARPIYKKCSRIRRLSLSSPRTLVMR